MLIWALEDPHSPGGLQKTPTVQGNQHKCLCRARAMVLSRVGSASPLALCALELGGLGVQVQPEAVLCSSCLCLLMSTTSLGENNLENAAIG